MVLTDLFFFCPNAQWRSTHIFLHIFAEEGGVRETDSGAYCFIGIYFLLQQTAKTEKKAPQQRLYPSLSEHFIE